MLGHLVDDLLIKAGAKLLELLRKGPRLGLQKDRPLVEPGEKSVILSFPRLGGLHHRYDVAA